MVRKIKIGKIEINFSNRWLYTFITIGFIILLGIIIYAVAPNPGHELSEIDLPSCSEGQVLGISDGSWSCVNMPSGDNLGNHIATQNIQLNNNWLSGDGGNEGVYIDANGNIGIGTTSPGTKLHVANQIMIGTPNTDSSEDKRGKIFIPSKSASNKGAVLSVMTYDIGRATDTCVEAMGTGWVDITVSCDNQNNWCAKLCFRFWQF